MVKLNDVYNQIGEIKKHHEKIGEDKSPLPKTKKKDIDKKKEDEKEKIIY